MDGAGIRAMKFEAFLDDGVYHKSHRSIANVDMSLKLENDQKPCVENNIVNCSQIKFRSEEDQEKSQIQYEREETEIFSSHQFHQIKSEEFNNEDCFEKAKVFDNEFKPNLFHFPQIKTEKDNGKAVKQESQSTLQPQVKVKTVPHLIYTDCFVKLERLEENHSIRPFYLHENKERDNTYFNNSQNTIKGEGNSSFDVTEDMNMNVNEVTAQNGDVQVSGTEDEEHKHCHQSTNRQDMVEDKFYRSKGIVCYVDVDEVTTEGDAISDEPFTYDQSGDSLKQHNVIRTKNTGRESTGGKRVLNPHQARTKLRDSMVTNSVKNILQCHICQKTFRQKHHLYLHMRCHQEKILMCPICNKRFARKDHLKEHIVNVHAKKNECTVCSKTFDSKDSLDLHNMVDHEKYMGMYSCSICEKRFCDQLKFEKHMRDHARKERFKCQICKLGSRSLSEFNVHMRIHSGEKPFQCFVCQKRFREKGKLTQHSRTHSEEKPFQCLYCEKGYRQKFKWKRHILKNHRPTHFAIVTNKLF